MNLVTMPLRWLARGFCASCCLAGCVLGLVALASWAFGAVPVWLW